MKNRIRIITLIGSFLAFVIFATGCKTEKCITVVVREQGSGTREAFDKVITDGEHFLEERDEENRKLYNTTLNAIQQTKTGTVISTVASDVNAIGYISVGSVSSHVKAVSVNGVFPTEQTVLNGKYMIQRPFVIMTSSEIPLTERTADFMKYLKSEAAADHVAKAGCVFLRDPKRRANSGKGTIDINEYEKKDFLPGDGKIVIRGSTSVEKVIMSAAKAYAELYGVVPEDIFDVQLEGSSVGKKAVENDKTGNIIGLSSASVDENGIDSFNICLDAVAVVVNNENTYVNDLTVEQLYGIFSGSITKFYEIK